MVVASVGLAGLLVWVSLAIGEPPPKSFWISDRAWNLFDAPEGARVDAAWQLDAFSTHSVGARVSIRPRRTAFRRWLFAARAKLSGRPVDVLEFEDRVANPGDYVPYVMLRRAERPPSTTWYFCAAHVSDLPETGRRPPALVGEWVRDTESGPAVIELRADGTFSAPPDARVPEGNWGVSDHHVLFESSFPPADPRWQFSVALWEPARNDLTRIDPGSETKPNEVYHRR